MQKISKLESDESGTESRPLDAPSKPVKLNPINPGEQWTKKTQTWHSIES